MDKGNDPTRSQLKQPGNILESFDRMQPPTSKVNQRLWVRCLQILFKLTELSSLATKPSIDIMCQGPFHSVTFFKITSVASSLTVTSEQVSVHCWPLKTEVSGVEVCGCFISLLFLKPISYTGNPERLQRSLHSTRGLLSPHLHSMQLAGGFSLVGSGPVTPALWRLTRPALRGPGKKNSLCVRHVLLSPRPPRAFFHIFAPLLLNIVLILPFP